MKELPFLESAMENAEVVMDSMLEDGLLKDLPVVGTFFKVTKGIQDIRDRAAFARVQAFVTAFSSVKHDTWTKWRKKVSEEPEETRKVGETLFLVVERLDSLEKAEILGLLFLAYLDAKISSEDLRRLTLAVNLAFADDLLRFAEVEKLEDPNRSMNPGGTQYPFLLPLAAAGLTHPISGQRIDDSSKTYYVASPVGEKFWTALRYARELVVRATAPAR